MKTKQTIIPVEIKTDYTHERGNEIENARQQIQLSGFYLQSLFNSIKYLASDLESKVEEKEVEYCYDLRNIADIGYAVCGSIFAVVSVFEDTENDIGESETVDAAAKPALKMKIKPEVPELLSALVNHDDCPDWLFEIIRDGFGNRGGVLVFTPAFFTAKFEEIAATEEDARERASGSGSSDETAAASETVAEKAEDFDFGTLEESGVDTLALALSEILNNPNLPAPLYNALQDAITDITSGSEAETLRPEYIAGVLRGFKRASKTDE